MIRRNFVRPVIVKLADELAPHLWPYDLARRVHDLEQELADLRAVTRELYVKTPW